MQWRSTTEEGTNEKKEPFGAERDAIDGRFIDRAEVINTRSVSSVSRHAFVLHGYVISAAVTWLYAVA